MVQPSKWLCNALRKRQTASNATQVILCTDSSLISVEFDGVTYTLHANKHKNIYHSQILCEVVYFFFIRLNYFDTFQVEWDVVNSSLILSPILLYTGASQ